MLLHETYMQRCLDLAINGIGNVAPNPMVGSVIVCDGKIIGEGYHQLYGQAHAEVNAINSVNDKSKLKNATIYINLEPCAHFGKTPPCADLIIKHQIPNVVIGCIDSFSEVAGKGIQKLEDAGCKVIVGVLEQNCLEINRRFFTFYNKQRPYIILKWAQTLDGFISNKTQGTTEWISNELCKNLSHKWRAEEAAIMVGKNTAKYDNPKLDVREWAGKNPIRIVIDKNLELDPNLNVFDGSVTTLVFSEKVKKFEGDKVESIAIDFEYMEEHILDALHKRNIQSVIIEGGAKTLQGFITKNLWDEARIFVGNKTFGSGIKAPTVPLNHSVVDKVGNNQLLIYKNK